MKIAFLSTFYPFRGGIAQFNAALYRALEQHHEIKAFNFSLQYPKLLFPGTTQLVSPNDNVDQIASKRVLNSINPASYRKTAKEIERYAPDILIIGYWMPFMAPSLGYVAGKLRKSCKVVAIVHNAIPHEHSNLDGLLSDYFFKRVDRVITLSESVAQDIHEKFPKLHVRTEKHPVYQHFGNRIDRSAAAYELELPTDKKYLLFFGLVRKYKGLDILLQALTFLPEDYSVIVAGEVYGSFESYQAIIDQNELNSRVHLFTSYIPDDQVAPFFSLANLCVLPYRSATQSGIIAIANHFHVPSVVSNVGGLSEFIEPKQSGWLVDDLTPENFALVIKQAIELAELTDKSVWENLNASLSWDTFAHHLLSFMES